MPQYPRLRANQTPKHANPTPPREPLQLTNPVCPVCKNTGWTNRREDGTLGRSPVVCYNPHCILYLACP